MKLLTTDNPFSHINSGSFALRVFLIVNCSLLLVNCSAPSKLNNESKPAPTDLRISGFCDTAVSRCACSRRRLRHFSSGSNRKTPFFFVCACVLCLSRLLSTASALLLRKEVIQPHLQIRLPCYDFTPIINPTFDCAPLAVKLQASGVTDSHGVTGGVYKARERIHRGMLIRDY